MNTVFIIPTGIGCSIGGHAGDATPAFKLIASLSDVAICNPNVVNASDINEMPDNTWYVEGSILNRFLSGEFHLERPKSNKILLVTNHPIQPETINAVNAARHTIGCEIEILELTTNLDMLASKRIGCASGTVYHWEDLVKQISSYNFDALAIASRIDCDKEVALDYLRNGGVNPWGGVEAVASKFIAEAIDKPVAHAPVETKDKDIRYLNEISPPRNAAEVLSMAFIHCVFKGLHKAPRLSDRGLSVRDIDCLITPYQCFGTPHEFCIDNNVPIIAIKENTTCLDIHVPDDKCFIVGNYIEAAGIMQCMKEGIFPKCISNSYG